MNVEDLQAMLATLPKAASMRLTEGTPRVAMLARNQPRVSSLVKAVTEALSDSGSTHHVRPPWKGEDVDSYPLVDVELATGTGQLRMSPGGVGGSTRLLCHFVYGSDDPGRVAGVLGPGGGLFV